MNSIVCSELNSILNMLGKEYTDLIPSDIIDTISKNMDANYQPVFTIDSLNIDELHPGTIDMLEIFYNKCWNQEDDDTIYIIDEE